MKSANLAMSDHLFRAAWRLTGRYRGLEVFVLPTLALAIGPAPRRRRQHASAQDTQGRLMRNSDADPSLRDHRLERLIERLPASVRSAMRWMWQPSARLVRIPAGVLLCLCGVFGILPLLGFWMLPLGLILLAEDVPPLRRATSRVLDWIERRRPHWFASTRPN